MKKFASIGEKQVTRAIVQDFCDRFLNNIENDVIIIGGGPSGLVAASQLAKDGIKVLLVEANNYIGGGFWIGGYLMNGVTVREPANSFLDTIGVPYKKVEDGLYLTPGPHAVSKLIAYACDQGVQILNMTKFDDVVMRSDNKVRGVVINWTPVSALPRAITCVDPVALESRLVIDATGHDAVVARSLQDRGLLKLPGCSGMWVEESEDKVVENTGEIHDGVLATGMAVATVHGVPRMGPTFGGMLMSGLKAAEQAKQIIESERLAAAV